MLFPRPNHSHRLNTFSPITYLKSTHILWFNHAILKSCYYPSYILIHRFSFWLIMQRTLHIYALTERQILEKRRVSIDIQWNRADIKAVYQRHGLHHTSSRKQKAQSLQLNYWSFRRLSIDDICWCLQIFHDSFSARAPQIFHCSVFCVRASLLFHDSDLWRRDIYLSRLEWNVLVTVCCIY